MRQPRFVQISFTYSPTINSEVVDEVVASEAFDWMRHAYNAYIVWSSSDCETICRKLLRVPGLETANLFVCVMDMSDGFGNLKPWMWEWLKRDRGAGPLVTWLPPPLPALPSGAPSAKPETGLHPPTLPSLK